MRGDYENWLTSKRYSSATITMQLNRAKRVEQYYGDFDAHYAKDGLKNLLQLFRYSTEDERRSRPNPTLIPIKGVLRHNLATYRFTVDLYRRFREVEGLVGRGPTPPTLQNEPPAPRLRERKVAPPPVIPAEHARTLQEFGFDGHAALMAVLSTSRYGGAAQAVAALTLFSHPDTVAQTEGKALFPSICGAPRRYEEIDGRMLFLDDNNSPTYAFCWCNGLRSGRRRDTQFNHVYSRSKDVCLYTAWPNICMTPAFLAKLTDGDDEIRTLLAYRSFDIYG